MVELLSKSSKTEATGFLGIPLAQHELRPGLASEKPWIRKKEIYTF